MTLDWNIETESSEEKKPVKRIGSSNPEANFTSHFIQKAPAFPKLFLVSSNSLLPVRSVGGEVEVIEADPSNYLNQVSY